MDYDVVVYECQPGIVYDVYAHAMHQPHALLPHICVCVCWCVVLLLFETLNPDGFLFVNSWMQDKYTLHSYTRCVVVRISYSMNAETIQCSRTVVGCFVLSVASAWTAISCWRWQRRRRWRWWWCCVRKVPSSTLDWLDCRFVHFSAKTGRDLFRFCILPFHFHSSVTSASLCGCCCISTMCNARNVHSTQVSHFVLTLCAQWNGLFRTWDTFREFLSLSLFLAVSFWQTLEAHHVCIRDERDHFTEKPMASQRNKMRKMKMAGNEIRRRNGRRKES